MGFVTKRRSKALSLLSTNARDSVRAFGEEGLIEHIRGWLGKANPSAPFGIGDDCAVLEPSPKAQVVTVDPIIYGRHFDDSVSPRAAAAKLLKRNLSDIAAMGAQPTAAVIALALSADTRARWLEQFYRGLAAEARHFNVKIVGGDIAQLESSFVATLTLFGHASKNRILTRRGAKIGDAIYVSGQLGGSLLGHHLSFTPRLAEGAWLADQSAVRCLMDLSDGLAKDLRALTPARARAALDTRALPISTAAKRRAQATGLPALTHALSDGEDYELVFAVDGKGPLEKFEAAWRKRFRTRLTRIGYFVSAAEPRGNEVDFTTLHGYEHLR
jgi:thiamine-monophosphate kinase